MKTNFSPHTSAFHMEKSKVDTSIDVAGARCGPCAHNPLNLDVLLVDAAGR